MKHILFRLIVVLTCLLPTQTFHVFAVTDTQGIYEQTNSAIQNKENITSKNIGLSNSDQKIIWPFKFKPLMLILIIVVTFSASYFIRLRLRHKKERQQLFLDKSKALDDLSKATEQIYSLTKSIIDLNHPNKDAELLKTDPENNTVQGTTIDDEMIKQLSNTKIISEEQWTVFVNTFNKVYPNFIKDIKQKHPDITFTEMRYLALSKLDLNTREIAFLVGVSQDAIRQTKCRLNKKLGARFDSEA
jgi:hypothetical protein